MKGENNLTMSADLKERIRNAISEFQGSEKEPSKEDRDKLVTEILKGMGELFKKSNGQEFSEEEIKRFFNQIPSSELYVRRENPEKIIAAFLDKKKLFIGNTEGEEDISYPNCAVYDRERGLGLKNAFQEGFGSLGGIVSVIGFHKNKDMIINNPEEEIDYSEIDRHLVRRARGSINPETDIDFVLLRVPRSITGEQGNGKFVFKGYLFPHQNN